MGRSRFTEEQILEILREGERGGRSWISAARTAFTKTPTTRGEQVWQVATR